MPARRSSGEEGPAPPPAAARDVEPEDGQQNAKVGDEKVESSEYKQCDAEYSLGEDDNIEQLFMNENGERDSGHGGLGRELDHLLENEDGEPNAVQCEGVIGIGSGDDENDNMIEANLETDLKNPKLYLGRVFKNRKEFKEAVINHEVKQGKAIKFPKNDKVRVKAVCKIDGCKWMIYASKMQRVDLLLIKSYISEHTCYWQFSNPYVTSTWIAGEFRETLRNNKDWKVKDFRMEICNTLKTDVSYTQARRAKKKALEALEGNHCRLGGYNNRVNESNPDTTTVMDVKRTENSTEVHTDTLGDQLQPPNYERVPQGPSKLRKMSHFEVHAKQTKLGRKGYQRSLNCSKCRQEGHNASTCGKEKKKRVRKGKKTGGNLVLQGSGQQDEATRPSIETVEEFIVTIPNNACDVGDDEQAKMPVSRGTHATEESQVPCAQDELI